MLTNIFTKAALLTAGAELVAAHSSYQNFVIDGVQQPPHFAVQSNSPRPVRDVTNEAMICHSGEATDEQVEVAPGTSVGMQWFRFDNETTTERNFPIAAGHLGPVLIYIADASTNGEGGVWHKIFEDGLSPDGSWAVDRFRANNGLMTIDLPDLAPGDYLIRPEIIALHQAADEGGAQFFLGCGQMKVTGSGSLVLPAEGTDMTKAYSPTDPGILVDIEGLTEYIIPGPPVLDAVANAAEETPAVEEEAEEVEDAENMKEFTFTLGELMRLLRQTARKSESANTRRHARGFQVY